ncbi:hypothetical protein [Streptomyces sp. NPDC091027]|uniref:hypothetical protein n=1 Tax=Streptomyces sp. NPDC091027 TaxID=3365971 RepID=UPI0037F31B82
MLLRRGRSAGFRGAVLVLPSVCPRSRASAAAVSSRRGGRDEAAREVSEFTQPLDLLLLPALLQVGDHLVLAAAQLPVLLAQPGDAVLDDLLDLHPGLRELAVHRGQTHRRVVQSLQLLACSLQFPQRLIDFQPFLGRRRCRGGTDTVNTMVEQQEPRL